jgi:Fucosyltransferase, N-terminal
MRRPLILFFNPFFATFPDTGRLGCSLACDFTQDRARMAEADAIVIHLPNCERIWQARKYPGQLWVAWSQESDVTVPALREPKFMRHFDLTMTYRRDADV